MRGRKEAPFSINPIDYAARADIAITSQEARKTLKDMGINIPNRIRNTSDATQVITEHPK